MSINECVSRLYHGSRGQSFQGSNDQSNLHSVQGQSNDQWKLQFSEESSDQSKGQSFQKSSGQSLQELDAMTDFNASALMARQGKHVFSRHVISRFVKALSDDSDVASIESLLKLQFAEPLPTVMQRAKTKAKVMPLPEAIQHVGAKLPNDILSLLTMGNNGTKQPGLVKLSGKTHGDQKVMSDKVFDRAMAFINTQFKTAREQMDIKLFECGFFKIEKENTLFETAEEIEQIAQDMGYTSAMITKTQGEIEVLDEQITKMREELKEHLAECKSVRSTLEAEKTLIEQDLRVINLIESTTLEKCKKDMGISFLIQACRSKNDRTRWQMGSSEMRQHVSELKSEPAQRAFSEMLSELFAETELDQRGFAGVNPTVFAQDGDDIDEDDMWGMQFETDSFMQSGSKLSSIRSAEGPPGVGEGPDVGTSNKVPAGDQDERCDISGKPQCERLIEKIAQLKGNILNDLSEKRSELDKHNKRCDTEAAELNSEIDTSNEMLTRMSTELAKAQGTLSNLQISHGQHVAEKRELCALIRKKYTECYTELKVLEGEMCSLMKIRQQVYNKAKAPNAKPGDPQMMIEDCQMGDWVVGPCSSTCIDSEGRPGVQLITRSQTVRWDPKSPEGKYGVSCPPSQVTRDCANKHCPIDCQMDEWSGWSECSAACGGGEQSRARVELRGAEFGGKECPPSSDVRQCAFEACDQDCVLADWSLWSSCSKACKWKGNAVPGRQHRTRSVAVVQKGAGKCPKPHTKERYETQFCNNHVCPRDIKCVADTDVVILLDGSGSLFSRYKPYDSNWQLSKKFAKEMIEHSKMATMNEKTGKAKEGMRYGIVLFSSGAHIVSPITQKKNELLQHIEGMKWPRTMTYTDRAFRKAMDMFKYQGSRSRKQVIILLTDGRATNRIKAHDTAREVREKSIRLIIVPVKTHKMLEIEMCGWATEPCAENLLKTTSFKKLIPKLNWYMSTMCTHITSASEGPPTSK